MILNALKNANTPWQGAETILILLKAISEVPYIHLLLNKSTHLTFDILLYMLIE